ncbi:hypothetical protein [uncultured Stenotrophomonas sp.]|uniref:hypothetical protein n=1 Tax=uncultured Stenotrophomonas sp. TaxID=165438 RepID=UPI0025D5A358|nr:hypothetical protein [uncultured Stenotrophomonas sp.]
MLESEADLQRWRVIWASAIALIRAVGHVLEKVDAKNPKLKPLIKCSYARWKRDPEHEIFREFIERERNNLLKEYESNVHPLEQVPVFVSLTLTSVEGSVQQAYVDTFDIGENIYRPLLSGPWEGDDCRDVLDEAIEWWGRELDSLDVDINKIDGTEF